MEDKALRFQDTTATKKVFGLKKKIRAVCGGTSASKTISILVWLIDYSQSSKNKLVSVVSESFPHLNLGAIRDFKAIMKDRKYWKESNWNETQHIYKFETGTVMEFFSSDAEKAHGPRRDVLFLNEAQNLPYEEADHLMVRTREAIWMDWNPTGEFWYYTELEGKRDDIDFLRLTYKDNEALDPEMVKEIEARRHRTDWWRVYGEGLLGEVKGQIYKDWQMIEAVPPEARLERRWLDYGYSNDPTAMGDIYRWNDSFILDELLYQKGLSNKQIADIILNQQEQVPVAADSAEPKSNDELAQYGIIVLPAHKGKDSINNGIQLVQQQKIFYTRRSVNIKKEKGNYIWEVDKDGRTLNVPIPTWNHHMDGIRYGFESLIEFVPNNIRDRQEELFNENRYRQAMNSTR